MLPYKLAAGCLGLVVFLLLTTAANASREAARGYVRDFSGHVAGTICSELFTDHPLLENRESLVVSESFVADGSYYGNRQFHNRNPMAAGTKLHECDATVVAFNGLPLGTIVRITNPQNGQQVLAVVQDRGGPLVDHRPDLSRGTFEALTPSEVPAEDVGLHHDLLFEVLVPVDE